MHTRFFGVYKVMHRGTLLITWYCRPPSVEEAACNLQTLSLWKCRELGYHLVTELSVSQACVPGSLPIHVRSAQSMYSFRKLLKTFLFQRAYS